jgi:FixJ family two-component response regulator
MLFMDFLKHPLLTGREREVFELLIQDNTKKKLLSAMRIVEKNVVEFL